MKLSSALPIPLAAIFSVISVLHAEAQGIPTCAQRGEGAALLEGECLSISGGYQRQNFDRAINSIVSDADQFSIGVQGQKKIADKWYVSIGAGFADIDAPRSDVGFESEVERYSLGAAIKYVQRDLLLGASFSVNRDDVNQTTPIAFANARGQGFAVTKNKANYGATLVLRAATLIDDGNGYYAKPSLDVGLFYTHTKSASAFFGPSGFGEIEASDHVFAFVTPALEVGLDLDYGGYSLRPFAFGGARFLFNEDETRTVNSRFAGIALNDDEVRFRRNRATAFLGAGTTLFASGGLSSRITYAASFQRGLISHNVTAQLQMDF